MPPLAPCCASLTRKARMRTAKVEGGARHEIELAHTRRQRCLRKGKACKRSEIAMQCDFVPAECQGENRPTCRRRVNAGANVCAPSVAVMIRLVRALDRQTDIGRLLVRHFRELGADLGEVEPRDALVPILVPETRAVCLSLRAARLLARSEYQA